MKRIRQQNPLILALAIIGVCAILYFFWQGYQQHLTNEQARSFFGAPPSGAVGQALKAKPKPPPQ
jgi:hypothetical protein